nr:serine/threonine-protein kinase [Rubripirellula tenax]
MRGKKLPIAALERIDDLCADFEQKWQSGDPPSIESLINSLVDTEAADVSSQRDALLAELIALEVDYRRRRGEAPSDQEYLDRFPADAKVIHDAINVGGKPTAAFAPMSVARLAELFPSLQIIELIGAGGMGAVYKARQQGLDRVVAIKILPEEFGHDVKFALRFTREARTLAKLNHPNIVALYEFGHVADTYYFLMEYVEGSTLRAVVKAGELTPPHALAIVPYLCDALQYAHDKGVVHRDIKPENILLSVDSSVKIADFGLSRILGNESQQQSLTGTHQVMGTPRYMAPEQFEGTHNVDHRADIYSLGVVIYEMLTGELPIGRFAAPSTKVEIDVRLDDVVLRTLEKEPQRRYQNASQIKSDVQSIMSTQNRNQNRNQNSSDDPALAPTDVYDPSSGIASRSANRQAADATFEQQDLAGRLLLTRRQLMDRVEQSLRPLVRGQVLQILFGVALIVLGAQCWARNTHVPHRLLNGLIVHVYGLIVISQAALVLTRLRRIDYSKPVDDIRRKLTSTRSGYLRAGVIIGFVWWLMWIPVCVAIGFDAVVLYRNSLVPSLVIGVVGFAVSVWLYWRALRSGNPSSERWRRKLSGESIAAAYVALDEIENAQIH